MFAVLCNVYIQRISVYTCIKLYIDTGMRCHTPVLKAPSYCMFCRNLVFALWRGQLKILSSTYLVCNGEVVIKIDGGC